MECCNREIPKSELTEDFYLLDTKKYSDRHVTVGYCTNPKCKAKKAQLLQYNRQQKRYEREKPKKRKDIDDWVKALKSEPYRDTLKEVEFGSYADMNWNNGEQTEDSEFAVDFNLIKRLVKTTNKEFFKEYKRNNLLYFPTEKQDKILVKSL